MRRVTVRAHHSEHWGTSSVSGEVAHISCATDRTRPSGAGAMIYVFGDCELDEAVCELYRGGVPVKLALKAFRVLTQLIQHRDRVRAYAWHRQSASGGAR
jgi:DNA-binding response OmpR family regulator